MEKKTTTNDSNKLMMMRITCALSTRVFVCRCTIINWNIWKFRYLKVNQDQDNQQQAR